MKTKVLATIVIFSIVLCLTLMIALHQRTYTGKISREFITRNYLMKGNRDDLKNQKAYHDKNRNVRTNNCDRLQSFRPFIINQIVTVGFPYKEMTANLSRPDSDVLLLKLIRNYWLKNPNTMIYKFNRELVDYSGGISAVVDSLLGYRVGDLYRPVGVQGR